MLTPPLKVEAIEYSNNNVWQIRHRITGGGLSFITNLHAFPYADIRISPFALVSPDTTFGTPNNPIEKLVIGDGTVIYGGLIAPSTFVCGDYVTIHKDVFVYGRSHCVIGHNSWFGMRCTLDCEGEYWEVGNNFGAGQDTHMWGHIAHGDVLHGCVYHDLSKGFCAGDDVWLVGRCTSAPVYHSSYSVALTESNLTKGMGPDQVWGGNPAKDLTGKLGPPYKPGESVEKRKIWQDAILDFRFSTGIDENLLLSIVSKFNVEHRTYIKDMKNPMLQDFFVFMLKKKKIKFVPVNHRKVTIDD
jgi:hypothetical protein